MGCGPWLKRRPSRRQLLRVESKLISQIQRWDGCALHPRRGRGRALSRVVLQSPCAKAKSAPLLPNCRPASECGVKVEFLMAFSSAVPLEFSSAQVVHDLVMPQTESWRTRYVDVTDPSLVVGTGSEKRLGLTNDAGPESCVLCDSLRVLCLSEQASLLAFRLCICTIDHAEPAGLQGRANYYVCHNLQAPFQQLVSAVRQRFFTPSGEPLPETADAYLWIGEEHARVAWACRSAPGAADHASWLRTAPVLAPSHLTDTPSFLGP